MSRGGLFRRVARLEEVGTTAAGAGAADAAAEAREPLERRLAALAARMRAHRGDRPLTPGEEAKASLAQLVAWRPRISPAAEARVRAFLAGLGGAAVVDAAAEEARLAGMVHREGAGAEAVVAAPPVAGRA